MGKGGNVTSAGWQVTLGDPIRHVSSRSGEDGLLTEAEPTHRDYVFFYFYRVALIALWRKITFDDSFRLEVDFVDAG